MKNNKLNEILSEIGLSENEARVYLAVLSLGPTTILKIARNVEVKRTTVYSTINSLLQKGLMIIEPRGLKRLFVAENPEKLESILDARREKLKKVMPEFSALYNLKGGESFIKYYEGLEAIKSIYERLLKEIEPQEDYMVISHEDEWLNLDKEYFLNFLERRARTSIGISANIRQLLQDSKMAQEHKKMEGRFNVKTKILPKNVKLSINLVITSKKIVIHQLVLPIWAIIIENKSVIRMHKELFEVIWNSIRD